MFRIENLNEGSEEKGISLIPSILLFWEKETISIVLLVGWWVVGFQFKRRVKDE